MSAVVEDAAGDLWVLCDEPSQTLRWHGPGDFARRWSQIDAVKVLSEGVR